MKVTIQKCRTGLLEIRETDRSGAFLSVLCRSMMGRGWGGAAADGKTFNTVHTLSSESEIPMVHFRIPK